MARSTAERFGEIVATLDMSGTVIGATHLPCGSEMELRRESDGAYAVVCPVCEPPRLHPKTDPA